jgi:hypothetical protein
VTEFNDSGHRKIRTSGTETQTTMSRKGQKGRSKKKAARSGAPPTTAPQAMKANSENAIGLPASASASASAPAPVSASASEVESTSPPSRSRLETPVAFEAPPTDSELSELTLPREDTSYPPVDLESPFFADHAHDAHAHDHDSEDRDPRMVLKRAPQTAQRRARFQQYVKLAVGAASALCLAALVKAAVAHNNVDEPPRKAAATVIAPPPPPPQPVTTALAKAPSTDDVPPPPTVTTEAPAPESATAPTPSAPQPSASAEAQPAPQASAAPEAPATQPAADTASESAPTTEPDPKAAAKEKHASQLALERGKVADAIEAGARSVALDPSDAEAWLILGAAYQQKGDLVKARQTFHACLEQGKRGPKWECAQFAH